MVISKSTSKYVPAEAQKAPIIVMGFVAQRIRAINIGVTLHMHLYLILDSSTHSLAIRPYI